MNELLNTAERLSLSLVLGGGSALGMAFRPILISTRQAEPNQGRLAQVVDELSVKVWNRYNRLSLGASLTAASAVAGQLLLAGRARRSAFIPRLGLTILMVLILGRKEMLDRQMKQRMQQLDPISSNKRDAEIAKLDQQVELLSAGLLITALMALVWPTKSSR